MLSLGFTQTAGPKMLQYNQILLGGGVLPISGFEVIQSGSQTQLVASVNGGSQLIKADLQSSGPALTATNIQIGSASATLLPSGVSGVDHVFAIGNFGTSLRIADVAAGDVGTFQAVQGSGGMGITALEVVTDGAAPTVLLAHDGGTKLGLFDISASNSLASAGPPATLDALNGAPISDVALSDMGAGVKIAVVASAGADTVVTVRLNANGSLVELDQAGVNTGVGIGAPSNVLIAQIDGTSFALVASTTTASITVFELGADGLMTVRDQINDSAATRFAGVQEAEMLMLDGRCFVALAGADVGVTVLQLLNDGSLHEVATYANDGFDTFGAITSLEMVAVGDTLHILTYAEGSDNIHSFSLDTGLLGDVVHVSTSGNTAQGTGLADLLIADTNNATLTGGAGADTFVFGPGADAVLITDYEHGVDMIDLSYWGRVFNLNALTVTELGNGIRFAFGADTLTIRTHDQQSLKLDDFANSDLFGLWRIPSEEQNDDIARDPDWTGTLSLTLGGDTDDTLIGNASDEVIAGMDGVDALNGFSGSDILAGGTGQDSLTGGAGQDAFIFDLDDNTPGDLVLDYEAAGFEVTTGTLSGDVVFVQNGSGAPVRSGNDVLIGGATLSGAGTGAVLVHGTTANPDLDVWSDGIAAARGSGRIAGLSSTLYDIGDTKSYAQMTFEFDVQGRVSLAREFGDNGTETRHSYDTADTASWQRITDSFDTAGRQTERKTITDNGTSATTLFDVVDNRVWAEILERRDAEDRQTEYVLTYDNGLSIRTITDVDDTASWDTILEYRDAGGTLYDKRTNFDIGIQLRTVWDTNSSASWDRILEYRDSGGALYDKRTNFDNDTQLRVIFDTDDSANWDTIFEYRDADGVLFDVDNTEAWDTYTRLLDSTGTVISESYDWG